MLKRRVALDLFIAWLGAAAALLHAPAHGQPAPSVPASAANANPVAATPADPAAAAASSAAEPAKQKLMERYQDGIVIWQTPDDATVPFLMKFNLNTQVRYLNTTDSETTFTDHLGIVREVNTRNDITVNRTMFILGRTSSRAGAGRPPRTCRPSGRRAAR